MNKYGFGIVYNYTDYFHYIEISLKMQHYEKMHRIKNLQTNAAVARITGFDAAYHFSQKRRPN